MALSVSKPAVSQATALLLAEWVNNIHEDPDAALRMIVDVCARAAGEHDR